MNAIAVILAAGEPRKLSFPKAMLEYEKGKSFLRSIASSFRKAGCDVMAVVGHRGEEVKANNPDVPLVENDAWKEGELSSARKGIAAALEQGAEAVILHPVDMPAVRASTVKSLLGKLDGAEAVVPEFEGAMGHPVVLSRSAAQKLLQGDGAGTVDAALPKLEVKKIATKDPGVMVNINSPEVYQRIFGEPPHAAPPPKKRGKAAAQE